MSPVAFLGFDIVSTAPIYTGFAVFRFAAALPPRRLTGFVELLQKCGMLAPPCDDSPTARAPGLDPVIGLGRLFGIAYRPPRDDAASAAYQEALTDLRRDYGLTGAWAHLTPTCVDVSRRQTDGIVSWRDGPPPGCRVPRFPTAGLDAERSVPRMGLIFNFELEHPLGPEQVGILLAFCRYWLAPYGDQVAFGSGRVREPADARCYLLGDLNIGDDRKTVQFRMENLIAPGEIRHCMEHVVGVVDSVHDVMPVRRAWFEAS
ncbi:MAG: hypothetical protein VX589_17640 [Myxococcota bacterium]|nr:hypothetical protein [Myxococcota bacterium]